MRNEKNIFAGAKNINKQALEKMQNENFIWYAIFVKSSYELATQALLKKQGIDCYLPLSTRWRRLRHISNYRRPVLVPVISGCLFVSLLWGVSVKQKINSANIKARIVGTNDCAAKLHGDILYEFILRNKNQFAHASFAKPKKLKVGDTAQITEGVLRGSCVQIQEIKNDTAIILAKLFGNIKTIKIPTQKLEPIIKEAA